MGFFKSIRTLQQQAEEIDRTSPPMADRLSGAMAQMQQAHAFMAQQTAAATAAVDPAAALGRALIVAVRDTGIRLNFDPVFDLDLLVTLPGQPPYPVTMRTHVSMASVARAQPGFEDADRVEPATPDAVHLDWFSPVG